MVLRSSTYKAKSSKSEAEINSKEAALKQKHQSEISRVIGDAKKFADDRKRALGTISNAALRRSVTR